MLAEMEGSEKLPGLVVKDKGVQRLLNRAIGQIQRQNQRDDSGLRHTGADLEE